MVPGAVGQLTCISASKSLPQGGGAVAEESGESGEMEETRYSNATGYLDERGHYDGLHFINLNSPGGGIELRGFDGDHQIENVFFRDCHRGTQPIDGPEDIVTNSFVSGVVFETTAEPMFAIEALDLIEPWEGWVALQFTSRYARAYSIQASPDLGIADPFGEVLQAAGVGPSTGALFFDPGAVLAPRRFYRVATP